MASETSMNHAGRTYGHTFRDLRSARRAKNRTRSHKNKYWNFRTITPADLPTSPSQKSHYIPTCGLVDCVTQGSPDNCPWNTFPANLSAAPVAKFTKREAFRTAQSDKPPSRRRSKKQYSAKWEAGKVRQREAREVIQSRNWFDDIWGWFSEVMAREEIMYWWDGICPCDSCLDWNFHWEGDKMYGCTWDDSEKDLQVVPNAGWTPDNWLWHRHAMGGWFRAMRDCEKLECVCVREWDEPVQFHELDQWWFATSPPEQSAVAVEEKEAGASEVVMAEESHFVVDDDWDVVSNVSTEAWTELESVDLDIPPHI